jgi:two-component system, sensor histidine kinase
VEPPPNSPARRVLVADDNPDAADSLALLISAWGYDVRVAYSGDRALQSALEFRPDVCLLDLGMPGLTGFEVAERLRQEPRTAGAVLAAVTGWGDADTRRRVTAAGFDYHLLKPAPLDELQTILAGGAPASLGDFR